MKRIDFEKEIAAMAEFHKGNRAEGLRLQEEFASEFRKEYADKDGVPAVVKTIEYDPNRSARIALLFYADGEKRYIIAPNGLQVN